jgi:hypothetical protein
MSADYRMRCLELAHSDHGAGDGDVFQRAEAYCEFVADDASGIKLRCLLLAIGEAQAGRLGDALGWARICHGFVSGEAIRPQADAAGPVVPAGQV